MKAEIAMKLSELEGFEEPKISLEQYMTPPELAADILHTAYMQGDVEDKKVVDPGTGTGIFAIGAALLGAEVVAVDRDDKALETARKNAESLGVAESIEFMEKDVSELEGDFDTVIMNPPFSVHSEEGVKFLEKALESAEKVYSVIYGGRENTVRELVQSSSHQIREFEDYEISLPATYGFHTEEFRDVEVGVLITSKKA